MIGAAPPLKISHFESSGKEDEIIPWLKDIFSKGIPPGTWSPWRVWIWIWLSKANEPANLLSS